jgi:hypothetical protein
MTGIEALRAIIADPELELVGLLTTTPEKVGRDAGDLCEMPATGVVATGDVEDILALRPDCFCYCGTAVGREKSAIEDMARLLAAGINVVTISTIPMIYAPAAPPAWFDTLERACRSGGASFYASGSEPGVCSLNIPAAMLGGAGRIDKYEMSLYALDLDRSYPIWEVLHDSMGFGQPQGYVPARVASGKVRSDWSTIIRYLADILGYELDDIALEWETLVAQEELQTEIQVLPKGTISGHRWKLSGMVAGQAKISVEYIAAFSSTPWPSHWPERRDGMFFRVKGRPSVELRLAFDPDPEDRGKRSPLAFTAMAVVNAIPRVVEAPSGVITDPITGRGAVSRIGG